MTEACAYFPGNYPRHQGRLRANGILTSSAYQIQERNSMQRPLLGKNPLGEATVMPCPRKPRIHRGGVSECLPVLIVFLMTTATCPRSTEPRSFTIMIRQPQRTSRETNSRMTPTATSGRFEFTKMCWPEKATESPC